jgi:hypothetical protein
LKKAPQGFELLLYKGFSFLTAYSFEKKSSKILEGKLTARFFIINAIVPMFKNDVLLSLCSSFNRSTKAGGIDYKK